MYKLVHTHTKLEIAQHLVEQYILFKFLHNVKYVLNQERDIIIHVVLKKNKARHKIKYFLLFENFQCFWNFFLNKKQPKKQNSQKQKQYMSTKN